MHVVSTIGMQTANARITLAEYEARGVDITLMTQEELAAEGYITPMNELQTLINGPGDYRMRNGKRVTIFEVAPAKHGPSATESLARGSVWRKVNAVGTNPPYATWHVSGRLDSRIEKPGDIVSKWSE